MIKISYKNKYNYLITNIKAIILYIFQQNKITKNLKFYF